MFRNPWLLILAFLLGIVSPAFAEGAHNMGYSESELALIRTAQIEVTHSRNSQSSDIVTRGIANEMVANTLTRLNTKLSVPLTEATLIAIDTGKVTPHLRAKEEQASFLSGLSYLEIISSVLGGILFMILIVRWAGKFLARIPKEVLEALFALIGIGIFAAQGAHIIEPGFLTSFFACVFIGITLILIPILHVEFFKIKEYKNSHSGGEKFKVEISRFRVYCQYVAPSVMMAAFATGALLTASVWLGGLTALALFVLLGFVGEVVHAGYVVGFRDDDALGIATVAGFLLVALFTTLRLFGIASSYLTIFETGSLVMGSLVGYLGLLIASTHEYPTERRQHWGWMQFISLVFGIAGVFFGSLIGASSLVIIAGFFLTLWAIEKILDFPTDNKLVPWLIKGICACALLYVIAHYGAPFYAAHFIH